MSIDENSQAILAASQSISAVFIKNLSNLTLNPSSKLLSTLPEYSPQQTGRRLNLQEERGEDIVNCLERKDGKGDSIY